jgi:hypothetical protein
MKYIKTFESLSYTSPSDVISEGLSYHLDNNIPLMESVYRIESEAWLACINEARDLWENGIIELEEDDLLLISTDAGRTGVYEGEEVLLDVPFYLGDGEEIDDLQEAEYRGRKVDLNKPFRTPSGPRKFAVYTKNESGRVIKLGFGQPGMRVNNDDPAKARSFRKRMRCDNPGPRWKARWWACNVVRYRKLLGIKSSRPW